MKALDIAAMLAVNSCVYDTRMAPAVARNAPDCLCVGFYAESGAYIPESKSRGIIGHMEPIAFHVQHEHGAFSIPAEDLEPNPLKMIPVGLLAERMKSELNNKTIVLFVYNDDAEMCVLDVHSLDERLSFSSSAAGAFNIAWKDKHTRMALLNLAAFFPHVKYESALESFGIQQSTRAAELYELGTALRALILSEFGLDITRQKTPGMLAARVFQENYLTEPVGHVRKGIRHQGMLSYWAGNNQAFGRGLFENDLRMYDAVSMYPNSCIQIGLMPNASDWGRMSDYDLETCVGGLCTVEFKFPDDELYPCLPVSSLGNLLFPLSGISDASVWEVRYALSIGAEIKLISGWCYNTGTDALKRYSMRMLAAKQSAEDRNDTPRRELYKLLANSIFGKLAQKRIEEKLEDKRLIAAKLGYSSIYQMEQVDNWQQQAQMVLGAPVPLTATTGGLWCPEWAALVNGYARAVEAQAMREHGALLGTTDNVLIKAIEGDPLEFKISGIVYKLKERIAAVKIIRTRLYVYLTEDGELDGGLSGFPRSREMLETVWDWNGKVFTKVYRIPNKTKFTGGIRSGKGIGVPCIDKWEVSYEPDTKRLQAGNFSVPHPFVSQHG